MGGLANQMRGLALEEREGKSAPEPVREVERGPVLLVLDSMLQCLPWESLPGLKSQRCV